MGLASGNAMTQSAVKCFFADLTGNGIGAGCFASVNELVRDIETYLAARNTNPKPYKWKAESTKILSKIKRTHVRPQQSRGRMSYITAIENRRTRAWQVGLSHGPRFGGV
jgi:hypothetical protein